MIEHSLARRPILHALNAALEASRDDYEVTSLLPYQWLAIMQEQAGGVVDDDHLIQWLAQDVWQNDADAENRQLASQLLRMFKERVDTAMAAPIEY